MGHFLLHKVTPWVEPLMSVGMTSSRSTGLDLDLPWHGTWTVLEIGSLNADLQVHARGVC